MLGQTIGHYRVIGRLGVGGQGVVYEAEDTRLSRHVALKFLPDEMADDTDAVRRLTREAQTIALLNHAHICTIYDVGTHQDRAFIAMERLSGTNLKLHMARARLDTREVIDIAGQVTEALEAAHSKGIVHRDIKPGNIFVSDAGHVKVLDFGLARRFRTEDRGDTGLDGSTIIGRPMGTANYMAPERILQMPLDPRCDLFSLGVVIYEMATGRLPFAGTSPSETVTNVLDHDPVPLSQLAPRHPAALERLVNRLLAKQAHDRHASAADLRDELTTLTDQLAAPPLARRLREWLGRHRPTTR
jgi:serine/threonine protein kinase